MEVGRLGVATLVGLWLALSVAEVAWGAELTAPSVSGSSAEKGASGAAQGLEQPRFLVKGFRFSGNASIDTATLEALVQDAVGRSLSLADLDAVAERATRYYREHGSLVARVFLPAQELTDGIVHFTVVEGQYGAIDLENDAAIHADVLRKQVRALQPGDVVRRRSLEQAVLLVADLPGIEADATLRAGRAPGTTDLVVAVRDDDRLDGSLAVDNHLDRASGAVRTVANLQWNNPTGYGDQLALSALLAGPGMQYGRAAYEAPLNGSELRLRLEYASSGYALAEEFAELGARGSAQEVGLLAIYPLIRSDRGNLQGRVGYTTTELRDVVGSLLMSARRTSAFSAALRGDRKRPGGRSLAWGLVLRSGEAAIESAAAAALDAATAQTAGAYTRLNGDVTLERRFGPNLRLDARLAGQWASKNLDSSQKLALGGPDGVRAYPVGEVSGDEGWLGRLELGHRLSPASAPAALEARVFLDGGSVQVNKAAWPGAGGPSVRSLYGVGAGLSWQRGSVSAETAYAVAVGTGGPFDLSGGRWWWQGVWRF